CAAPGAGRGWERAGGALGLEQPVLWILAAPPQRLPGLAPEQDPHVTLDALPIETALGAPVIRFVGCGIRLGAVEVAEPGPNLFDTGGIARVGRLRVGTGQ